MAVAASATRARRYSRGTQTWWSRSALGAMAPVKRRAGRCGWIRRPPGPSSDNSSKARLETPASRRGAAGGWFPVHWIGGTFGEPVAKPAHKNRRSTAPRKHSSQAAYSTAIRECAEKGDQHECDTTNYRHHWRNRVIKLRGICHCAEIRR